MEYEIKKEIINDKERNVINTLPNGWVIDNQGVAPKGYVWVNNNKSRFGGERVSALLKLKKLKNFVLEDNESENGGVSFNGETLGDFCDELDIDLNNMCIKYLNIKLNQCGIKGLGD